MSKCMHDSGGGPCPTCGAKKRIAELEQENAQLKELLSRGAHADFIQVLRERDEYKTKFDAMKTDWVSLMRERDEARAACAAWQSAAGLWIMVDSDGTRRCFHCDEFSHLKVWPEHGNPNCEVAKAMASGSGSELLEERNELKDRVTRQHSMLNEALANVLKLAQELEHSRKEIRELQDGKGGSTSSGELRAKSTVSR